MDEGGKSCAISAGISCRSETEEMAPMAFHFRTVH